MIKIVQRHSVEHSLELARLVDTGALDYLLDRMEKKLYEQWSVSNWNNGDWEQIYNYKLALKKLKTEIMICIEHKDK